MSAPVKFVRIRGRIVPIKTEEYESTRLSKKQRASATDTVNRTDAVKDLRKEGRGLRKAARGLAFSSAGVIGIGATIGIASRGLKGVGNLVAKTVSAGYFGLGGVLGAAAYSTHKDSKQVSKDASRLARFKPLKENAYRLSKTYEQNLTADEGTRSAARKTLSKLSKAYGFTEAEVRESASWRGINVDEPMSSDAQGELEWNLEKKRTALRPNSGTTGF